MRLRHALKTGQFEPEFSGQFEPQSDGQIETELDGQFKRNFRDTQQKKAALTEQPLQFV
jgi:hypothetical protein